MVSAVRFVELIMPLCVRPDLSVCNLDHCWPNEASYYSWLELYSFFLPHRGASSNRIETSTTV